MLRVDVHCSAYLKYVLGFSGLVQLVPLYADEIAQPHAKVETTQIQVAPVRLDQSVIPQLEELWLEVSLNQQPTENLVVLKDQNDQLYFSQDDLKRYRIHPAHLRSINYQQQHYYNLKHLDAKIELNLRQMTLALEIPVHYFDVKELSGNTQKKLAMTRGEFGSYLNYDMVVNYADQRQEADINGAFEWVTFSPWGSFNTTFISRNMNHDDIETLRLDSYVRFDDPEHGYTFQFGDAVSRGTSWSGGVNFAGLQWGTNTATQPNLNRLPFMSLGGEVISPSTIDVYVNDVLQSQQKIDAGAFSINNIATVSGHGVAKVVVKDLLGRQQVISQNFYTNPELLRQDLSDYQIEIGTVRQEYGREGSSYDQFMAATTWRRGISRYFTLESHAQMLDQQWMVGLGGYHTLPYATRLGWVYAHSHNGEQQGWFGQLLLRKQALKFSVGIDHQVASEAFWKLGQQGMNNTIKQVLRMYSSFNLPYQLNFSVNYLQQQSYIYQTASMLSLNLSKVINNRLGLQMLANHQLENNNMMFGLGLNFSFDNNRSASTYSSLNASDAIHQLRFQRSAPLNGGVGYQLQTTLADQRSRYEASFDYKNRYMDMYLQLSQATNDFNMRSSFNGGLVLLDGQLMPSRKIDDSFGLVHIPNLQNVRFYAENQEIGRTNKQGYGVVPRLRSYQTNQLLVEQADLPMNVDIRSLSMNVTPYAKSGLVIDFPIKVVRDAFFILEDEQQQPVTMGTILKHENGEETIVGARGEVYLFDVPERMILKTTHLGQMCQVVVDPQLFEESEHIPTLRCIATTNTEIQP